MNDIERLLAKNEVGVQREALLRRIDKLGGRWDRELSLALDSVNSMNTSTEE